MPQYLKLANHLRFMANELEGESKETDSEEYRRYKLFLDRLHRISENAKKIKGEKEGYIPAFNRLNIILATPRLRKPDLYWALKLDKGEGAIERPYNDILQDVKFILRRDLPVSVFLRKLFDYGVAKGITTFNRMLENKMMKSVFLPAEKKIEREKAKAEEAV